MENSVRFPFTSAFVLDFPSHIYPLFSIRALEENLKDEPFVDGFRQFMQSEFAEESLDFYLEAPLLLWFVQYLLLILLLCLVGGH